MRIAVSADNKQGLDSVVSPHFGRCPHYILVDVADQEVTGVQEVDSPFYGHHQPGQVPAFIHSLGANVMLAGGMGGRAIMFFEQFGIEGVTGAYGTVRQSLERYLGGQLRGAAPCKESQEHGHGELPASEELTGGVYEKDELGRLKEEADMLRQQLAEVSRRLGQLGQ
jgi:predicted Fe-Mo cluster-binding NifX family protein